jgi:hypothetical protein
MPSLLKSVKEVDPQAEHSVKMSPEAPSSPKSKKIGDKKDTEAKIENTQPPIKPKEEISAEKKSLWS